MLNFIKNLYGNLTSSGENKDNLYIHVPYIEKDEVKNLGAKWDPIKKLWFIPYGLDKTLFKKWINDIDEQGFNFKATGFFVAETSRSCWKCKNSTPVFAFLLVENHQEKDYDDNDEVIWTIADYKSILSYVSPLNKKSLEIIQKHSSNYYLDFSQSGSYFMNHCKSCNSMQGDFYIHSEPGVAFQPMNSEQGSAIKLYWYNELFEASVGSFSIGVDHFEHMLIIKN